MELAQSPLQVNELASPLRKRKRVNIEEGTPPKKRFSIGLASVPLDKENAPNSPLVRKKPNMLSKLRRKSSKSNLLPQTESKRKTRKRSMLPWTPKRKGIASTDLTNFSLDLSGLDDLVEEIIEEKECEPKTPKEVGIEETPKEVKTPRRLLRSNSASFQTKLNRSLSLVELKLQKITNNAGAPDSETTNAKKLGKSLRRSLKNCRTTQQTFKKEAASSHGKESHYFGVPLQKLMQRQRAVCGLEEMRIPYFIQHCISTIISQFLSVEGIFRVSPRRTDLLDLQKRIEETDDFGHSYFTTEEAVHEMNRAHLYCGLIKIFLRELSPLLDSTLYDEWVGTAQGIGSATDDSIILEIQELLTRLPSDNVALLMDLLRLSQHIIEHKEDNKMNLDNISRVIGSNLLWNDNIMDPVLITKNIFSINRLTEFMIQNYDQLTTEDEETESEEETK